MSESHPTSASAPMPAPAPAAGPAPDLLAALAHEGPEEPLPEDLLPSGGFQPTPALLARRPPMRGLGVPPWPEREVLLAWHAHLGSPPALDPAALAAADAQAWGHLCDQYFNVAGPAVPAAQVWSPAGDQHEGLRWVVMLGVAWHGPGFMLAVVLALLDRQAESVKAAQAVLQFAVLPLSWAISALPQEQADQVLAPVFARAGRSDLDHLLLALLLPHHRLHVELAMANEGRFKGEALLRHANLGPGQLGPYLDTSRWYPTGESTVPCAVLHLSLFGAEVVKPVLEQVQRCLKHFRPDEAVAGWVELLGCMRWNYVVSWLANRSWSAPLRQALEAQAEHAPACVVRHALAAGLVSGDAARITWAVSLGMRHRSSLGRALRALSPELRRQARTLIQPLLVAQADEAQLPEWLRQPPWLGKRRKQALPTLALPGMDRPEALPFTDAELQHHRSHQAYRQSNTTPEQQVDDDLARALISPQGRARVHAGQPLQPGDVGTQLDRYFHHLTPNTVLLLEGDAGLALWNSYPGAGLRVGGAYFQAKVQAVLARYGTAALPGLVAAVAANPLEGFPVAMAVDSPRLVPVALRVMRHQVKARNLATKWLLTHPDTAAAATLALAFGQDKAARDDAQFGLRWMLANGLAPAVEQAAREAGAPAQAALQALREADPLHKLPARMPALPAFVDPTTLARPVLREGGAALTDSAMRHVASMLAISPLQEPYAGLQQLKALCTPESLAEFAWTLFRTWELHDAPPKENWAFHALAHLGDDCTLHRLVPLIRRWPTEGLHQRAMAGLDLLAAMGTDAALMHLSAIAARVKSRPLQKRAQEKVALVAQTRGFSAEELADRLVPDLGLDDQGTLVLDFGPRQFALSFDESLKPLVKDDQGVRLKDLPAPLASDDPTLAAAAVERFKQLKKEAKAVASLQVQRLEDAMVMRRRWTPAEFQLFFLQHPLMRHLAARLAWGVYDASGALQGCLRVAEDWTLADEHDQHASLPADAQVGVAHVLDMSASQLAALGQLWADYKLAQPFRQLGRETFQLTDDERTEAQITRYAGRPVATGSIIGLSNRHWQRAESAGGGWVDRLIRPLGDGQEALLQLEPGYQLGDTTAEPQQTIARVVLRSQGSQQDQGEGTWGQLHPVLASEVLRDLAMMPPYKPRR